MENIQQQMVEEKKNVSIVLKYFPIMGAAERVRLALWLGGIAFDDVRVPHADWVIPPETKGMQKWNFLGKISEEILMKMTRYSEPQILAILRQAEGGVPVSELCREHGMSNASFYKWRSKYGGMDASMISQMKALEDENRRLKKMYAEMSMQAELLKEALGKK